eukprot:g31430.t1
MSSPRLQKKGRGSRKGHKAGIVFVMRVDQRTYAITEDMVGKSEWLAEKESMAEQKDGQKEFLFEGTSDASVDGEIKMMKKYWPSVFNFLKHSQLPEEKMERDSQWVKGFKAASDYFMVTKLRLAIEKCENPSPRPARRTVQMSTSDVFGFPGQICARRYANRNLTLSQAPCERCRSRCTDRFCTLKGTSAELQSRGNMYKKKKAAAKKAEEATKEARRRSKLAELRSRDFQRPVHEGPRFALNNTTTQYT